jgi:hypothetical protein
LSFQAASNRTYTVQATGNPASGDWSKVRDVVARSTNHCPSHVIWISDNPTRSFYRVTTPQQP